MSVQPIGQHDGAVPGSDLTAMGRELRLILDSLPAMVGYWDRDLRNRMANAAYVDYFGRTPEQIRGIHISELLGPEVYELNLPFIRRALQGEEQLFDRTLVSPEAAVRHTQASYIPDVDDGEVRGFFVLVTDVTQRRVAEEAQAAAEQRFRTLFDMAPLGTFLVDGTGRVLDANPAAAAMLGYPREQLIGMASADFTDARDRERGAEQRAALLRGDVSAYRIEKRYRRADGDVIWAQLDARLLEQDGDAPVLLGQVQDITWRREQQEELERIASHDALTGLQNRRGLLDALSRSAARRRRDGGTGALLVLDLDHFKEVNDTQGHDAGDRVLTDVAGLLRARLRLGDVAARHGGDEFAVVLDGVDLEQATAVADDLERLVAERRLGVPERPVTVSIGVAVLDGTSSGLEALTRADRAMYATKHGRRA